MDTPEKIEMMEKRISPFINNILGSASPLSRGSVSPVSKESVVKRVRGKASRGLAISAEGGASTVAKAAKVSAKRSPERPQIVRKGSGDEAESKFRDQKQTDQSPAMKFSLARCPKHLVDSHHRHPIRPRSKRSGRPARKRDNATLRSR